MWAILLALPFGRSPIALAQDTTRATPVNLHGFVEIYYRSGDPLTKDGYRLRKADLKFSGDISPHLKWRVGFDAAKALTLNKATTDVADSLVLNDVSVDQRSRMLQDAALTYAFSKTLNLDVGQQIVPLSLEGTIPTALVETIERTLFIVERSRAVGLGDVRDIGVSANGLAAGTVEYHVGLFNETGESQGTIDANDQKALIGRIAIHPGALPGVQFGGSGGFEGGPRSQRRERAGGEVQYRDKLLMLRGETMSARDGALRRFGWYGLGAVRATPRLQLVTRVDSWDRDRTREVSVNDALERQIVAGAVYLLDGSSARVMFNVVRQTFPNVRTVPAGTIFLLAFEAVW